MEILYEISRRLIKSTSIKFIRYLTNEINWDARLIEITGSRGVGKTTLMLQYIKTHYKRNDNSVIYFSADDPYFYNESLIDTIDKFVKHGGKRIFIDEVHKYLPKKEGTDWSGEIKAAYDRYPGLKIVYSGSSIINVKKGKGDLSRRVSPYFLPGMSFREYLEYNNIIKHDAISLDDIIGNHTEISEGIIAKTTILNHFKDYIKHGYYAFYNEDKGNYYNRIKNTLNLTLESDIPATIDVSFTGVRKIKKLLSVIATSVPYVPNLNKVKRQLEIADHRTLLKYLSYLEMAEVINTVGSLRGAAIMKKPEKILISNTNLCYALGYDFVNTGSLREIFFVNQLNVNHSITLPKSGDYLIDGKYTFEVGGPGKSFDQIKDIDNSYLALDETETGIFNKIPLWLFGFLY
jgi:predicted AAA+ superfamily ATPase